MVMTLCESAGVFVSTERTIDWTLWPGHRVGYCHWDHVKQRSQRTRVAAVQMEARVADLAYNVDQAFALVDEALRKQATIIALPEFFTTQIVYDERLFACSLSVDNPVLARLAEKARRHGVVIGGSYLEMRGCDVFNTYVLVEPDGSVHRHCKDLPTMVENAFYTGGDDDGYMQTEIGEIGAAVCWEMIRTNTVHRLRGRVDLLMTGSHWWGEPGWKCSMPLREQTDRYNSALMSETPRTLARLIGAPLVHAGHAGPLEGRFLLLPGSEASVVTKTRLVGESQIIDETGEIVARRRGDQGAGVVVADIALGRVAPALPVPKRFWIPKLPLAFKGLWWHQNVCGKSAYATAKRAGRLRTVDGDKSVF